MGVFTIDKKMALLVLSISAVAFIIISFQWGSSGRISMPEDYYFYACELSKLLSVVHSNPLHRS